MQLSNLFVKKICCNIDITFAMCMTIKNFRFPNCENFFSQFLFLKKNFLCKMSGRRKTMPTRLSETVELFCPVTTAESIPSTSTISDLQSVKDSLMITNPSKLMKMSAEELGLDDIKVILHFLKKILNFLNILVQLMDIICQLCSKKN